MKTVRFVPLAFLAGVHGFAMFAPYLAVFLTAVHFLRRRDGARLTVAQIATMPNLEK